MQPLAQGVQGPHVLRGDLEVEHRRVLPDVLRPRGLRDLDEAVLEAPADQGLGRAPVILF